MIPRITKGTSARAGLQYDHSLGKCHEKHEDPHRVAGTAPGRTWQARAAFIDAHSRGYATKDGQKTILRTALRVADEDRTLTEKEWRAIAKEYAEGMGYDLWEATRHSDNHVHLTASIYNLDGTRVPDQYDYKKAQAACREIEQKYGLVDASKSFNPQAPEVSPNETAKARRTGIEPERLVLRQIVDWAAPQAKTPAEFVSLCAARGVSVSLNQSDTTGRISGYSVHIDGHDDKDQAEVWFKGSSLGKAYGWQRVAEHIEHTPEPEPVFEPAEPEQFEAAAEQGSDNAPEPSALELMEEEITISGAERPGWFKEAVEKSRVQDLDLEANHEPELSKAKGLEK